MKIPDHLLSRYKKRFGDDIKILDHSSGPTWNDGGSWNYTIIQTGEETLGVKMESDYRVDDLDVVKLKTVLKPHYVPIGEN